MYTSKTTPEFRDGPIRIPSVRFAIVGCPRTGSSHLGNLLDSHPDIAFWDDEIFAVGEVFDQSVYDTPRDFLMHHVFKINAQAVGFKLLYDAMGCIADVWELFKELDIRLVHTYRENMLDSFISLQLALLNQAFTSYYNNAIDQLLGEYKVRWFTADFDECLGWFEFVDQCNREIRQRSREEGVPCIEIEYRALCENQGSILDFLNLPRRPLRSVYQKQRKGRQAEIIMNYGEIKEKFAGSQWATYFED